MPTKEELIQEIQELKSALETIIDISDDDEVIEVAESALGIDDDDTDSEDEDEEGD